MNVSTRKSYTQMGKAVDGAGGRRGWEGEDQGFSVRHVDYEMSVTYPSGEDK